MIIIEHKYRKRRKLPKSSANPPPPPPPPGVTVVSVFVLDAETLQWVFSANIASLDSNVEQLMASVAEGMQSPSGVSQVGPATLWAGYADGNFSGGGSWQVNDEPVGMTFAGGAVVAIPQSGTIEV